jgi:hypothetical protein
MKNRTWKEEELRAACEVSYSLSQVIRLLGLVPAGGNYAQIKKYIKEYCINISHFTGKGHLKGKSHSWCKRIPLCNILQENVSYKSSALKKRLLEDGIFKRKCNKCGNVEWLGEPIPLELDHINGEKTDNRLQNLCLLCPNCHALTPTYRGKNQGRHKLNRAQKQKAREEQKKNAWEKQKRLARFCFCGKKIKKNSKTCMSCRPSLTKIEWPPFEKVLSMVHETSFLATGKTLGVSDNAVRKFLKKAGREGSSPSFGTNSKE